MKKILSFSCLLLTTTLYAHTQSVVIQFKNHTSAPLRYMGVDKQNRANTFAVDPSVIAPNGMATITATTNENEDVAGELHFQDSDGRDNVFLVVDPRNFHIIQPLFYMKNDKYHSEVNWRIINGDKSPRALFVVGVGVDVEER